MLLREHRAAASRTAWQLNYSFPTVPALQPLPRAGAHLRIPDYPKQLTKKSSERAAFRRLLTSCRIRDGQGNPADARARPLPRRAPPVKPCACALAAIGGLSCACAAARERSGGERWGCAARGEMAAAVLAAPEGGSAAMPMGSAATCPPPAGPAGPGSWSRSLDRALEEAAASGTLSLSGRKLRDYPRASAANHDLSDTTRAGERPDGMGWDGTGREGGSAPQCRARPGPEGRRGAVGARDARSPLAARLCPRLRRCAARFPSAPRPSSALGRAGLASAVRRDRSLRAGGRSPSNSVFPRMGSTEASCGTFCSRMWFLPAGFLFWCTYMQTSACVYIHVPVPPAERRCRAC